MKLVVMQPYFFPYLGYFSLIKNADKWIVLDLVQYIKQGWINRNRILKPNEGWQYIIVPVRKHSHDTLIKDIIISQDYNWKNDILKKLDHYRKKAPFFGEVSMLIKEIFGHETDSLGKFNIFSLKHVCNYLKIPFNYEILSEMDISLGEIRQADDWALQISRSLGAEEYINAPGGKEFFKSYKFISAGIKLKFLKINFTEYDQKRDKFEAGLSIIDVMMFNSKGKIQEMLDDYEFI